MAAKETEPDLKDVRECIKLVDEKAQSHKKNEKEVIYYNQPNVNGAKKRRDPVVDIVPQDTQEITADTGSSKREGSLHKSRRSNSRDSHSSYHEKCKAKAAGRIYAQVAPASQLHAPVKRIVDQDFVKRFEFYQNEKERKLEELRKQKKEQERQKSFKAKKAPESSNANPRVPLHKRNYTNENLSKSMRHEAQNESLEEDPNLTFKPAINPGGPQRSIDDQFDWMNSRNQRIANKRVEKSGIESEELTFTPEINEKSKEIATRRKANPPESTLKKSKEEYVKEYLEKEQKWLGKPKIGTNPQKEAKELQDKYVSKKKIEEGENNVNYFSAVVSNEPVQDQPNLPRHGGRYTEHRLKERQQSKEHSKEKATSKEKTSKEPSQNRRKKPVLFSDRPDMEIIEKFKKEARPKSNSRSSSRKQYLDKSAAQTSKRNPETTYYHHNNLPMPLKSKPAIASQKHPVSVAGYGSTARPGQGKQQAQISKGDKKVVNQIIYEASLQQRANMELGTYSPSSKSRKKPQEDSILNTSDSKRRGGEFDSRYWYEKQKGVNEGKREKKLHDLIYRDETLQSSSKI